MQGNTNRITPEVPTQQLPWPLKNRSKMMAIQSSRTSYPRHKRRRDDSSYLILNNSTSRYTSTFQEAPDVNLTANITFQPENAKNQHRPNPTPPRRPPIYYHLRERMGSHRQGSWMSEPWCCKTEMGKIEGKD